MNYNPADHYVQVLAIVPGKELECRERVSKMCEDFAQTDEGKVGTRSAIKRYYMTLRLISSKGRAVMAEVLYQKEHEHPNPHLEDGSKKKSPYKASWWEQFKAVYIRSLLSMSKDPLVTKVRIIQTLVS